MTCADMTTTELGFEPTGELDDDEIVARLILA
jgi:hypothetical protein